MNVYVGIDVSKTSLDVYLHPLGQVARVANTAPGLKQLKRMLAPHIVALIAIEATGKWHRHAHRALHAAGYAVAPPVAIVNPYRSVPSSPTPWASWQRPTRSMPACWRCLPRASIRRPRHRRPNF